MFHLASNQDIGGWAVDSVTSMESMFHGATAFNQHWCLGDRQRHGPKRLVPPRSTNQDIGAWDTSGVKDMTYMFSDASAFDQDIGAWDTSSGVTAMYGMFRRLGL